MQDLAHSHLNSLIQSNPCKTSNGEHCVLTGGCMFIESGQQNNYKLKVPKANNSLQKYKKNNIFCIP